MVDLSLSIASMALKKNDDETYEQVLPVTIVGQSPHYTYLSNILNKLKVKQTQQYDVCFSSDTLKSDVVVFPSPFPPADAELISINGGDTFTRTQTLPSTGKVSKMVELCR